MPSLSETQKAFADFLLKPAAEDVPAPAALKDIAADRLGIYGHLLRGTVDSCLCGIYPQTKSAMRFSDADWKTTVEMFRRSHPNVSYMLLYAVEQFHVFLAQQSALSPWLPELARYEWLEAVVQNLPDTPLPEGFKTLLPESADAFETLSPVWNEARVIDGFDWPVTAIAAKLAAGELPENCKPESGHLLIYRDPVNYRARFFTLNPLTASLIKSLASGRSYAAGLADLVSAMPALQQLPFEAVRTEAAGALKQCLSQGILLGSAPVTR